MREFWEVMRVMPDFGSETCAGPAGRRSPRLSAVTFLCFVPPPSLAKTVSRRSSGTSLSARDSRDSSGENSLPRGNRADVTQACLF